jgi:hypothetical protein
VARKRRCKGKTKRGTRCKAWALQGTDRCSAHPPANDPLSPAFGSPEQASAAGKLGGRPRNPRVVDVLRDKIEAEIETVIAPYFDALKGAMLHATYEGDVIVSEHPDLGARINAAEKLLDRTYGKPRQTIEHAGPQEGAPIAVEFSLDADVRKAISGALRQRPASS